MNGIQFGELHSYDDLSLILNSKTIEAPSPKTDTLEVDGMDGVLDFTEYFGSIKYKNRKLTFEFSTIVPRSQFLSLFTTIQNSLHGKRMKIILDDDPNYYYMGRLSCNSWKANKRIGTITIDADCDPYKYKLNETVISQTIGSSAVIIECENLKRNVVPTFVLSAEMQITFEGTTYTLSSGTFQVPEIEFVEGTNTLTVSGAGNIQIKYQEATL